MMRAMYSGVAGLKTHQTKMDVIGNNIANVNTVAFKSSSTTFSEIMYQNVSGASGPSATTGRGGVNAKQIGLGVTTGSTTVNISSPGSTQTTGDGFDLAITGDSFFVVNNGTSNVFTKAGAFYIDGAGNLAMKSTGYNVMGWQVDPNTGDIRKDTVSPLRIMQEKNLTSPPEPTTLAVCGGVLDRNSTTVNSDDGYVMSLAFFDALGYSYEAKFAVKSTSTKGEYNVELVDITDSNGVSLVDVYNATELSDIVTFGSQNIQAQTTRCELLPNCTYDDATGNYYREMAFPDIASDFTENRVAGFEYTVDNITGNTITTTGRWSTSASALQELYDGTGGTRAVIYDDTNNMYYTSDENGNRQTLNTEAEWAAFFGVPTITATKAADGTMDFSFNQNFTLVDNATPTATANQYRVQISQAEAYGLELDPNKNYAFVVAPNGAAQVTVSTITTGNVLRFNVDTGLFTSIAGGNSVTLDFANNVTDRLGNTLSLESFSDIDIDFTTSKWYNNGGISTLGTDKGGLDGTTGTGKRLGDLIGLSVSNDGTIWGAYDNGNTVLLGQIAVAVFANPSGLEKIGENCYQTTLNSGEFDGIGQEVNADGGKMTSGVLEMSNVDLSTEFTEMITTQRGFQANSRIITTSDTLLEELVNLKR